MRLFAALDPPPDVATAMTRLRAAADSGETARWRWSPAEHWHLTVAFFGEVADAAVPDLAERLRRAAGRTPPMTLAPAVVIGFPTTARAHVVALSVSGDVAELRRLAQRCAAAGRRAGLEMERRRFRPHVTLARASSRSAPVDARRVVASYDGPPWPVTTLRLVHSTIGAVVTHRTLATWPVGAEGADQLTAARRPSRRSG